MHDTSSPGPRHKKPDDGTTGESSHTYDRNKTKLSFVRLADKFCKRSLDKLGRCSRDAQTKTDDGNINSLL